jgi:P4 family phage/plasmid primase-like protien
VSPGFADTAQRLLDNGYTPIPIAPGKKRPAIKDWNSVNYKQSPHLLEELCNKHSNASTGILLGDVCAIDIDVLDTEVACACRKMVTTKLGNAPCRYGKHPKSAFFFRVHGSSFKKLATKAYQISGDKAQVEIHCDGQQMVVFGIHPDTQKPYYWHGEDLLEVPFSKLPEISETEARALLKDLELELASKSTESKTALSPTPTVTPMAGLELAPPNDMKNITDALGFVDPQDYNDWVAVGHALKTGGEQYLEIFQKWSKRRPDGSIPCNFVSGGDVKKRWNTFKPERTSLAEVFRKAAGAGWTGASPFTLPSNSHTVIARTILAEMGLREPKPVYADGELWRYNSTHWLKVEGFQQRQWVQDLDGNKVGVRGVLHANKSLIDGVLNELHAMCSAPEFFRNLPSGINCESGFICIGQRQKPKLMPHSPDLRQRFCIPAEWQPGACVTPSPLTEQFFSGIWNDRNASAAGRRVLEEILGVALAGLSTELKSPKAFVLHGSSGANGKSQFIKLLQGILPSNAHSAISPSDMGKEQFLVELVGKTANLANELSSVRVISSDKMKAVISGDIVSAKRVYQAVFQFAPKAIHVFTANILPSFQGGVDEGIKRRFVVVPFTETIPESKRVPEIAKRILERENKAILSLAVVGAARMLDNGIYSISPEMEQATEEWFQDADNLMGWIDEGGINKLLKHNKRLSYDEAYRSYREVVESRGPREWISRYSVFKRIVREYVKKDPELDIVRHSEGYRIVERKLVYLV